MAKNKTNSMQDKVVSGLYLTSVAFTFTILSRLAGNIMYGGSENETIKDQETKKLQEIITKINSVEEKNPAEISKHLSAIIRPEMTGENENEITFSELGKYYHFNTLYDILPKKAYDEACGDRENALGHHKFGKTKWGGIIFDIILGITMPFIILYYSGRLIYDSVSPGKKGELNIDDDYVLEHFGNKLRNFINSNVPGIEEYTTTVETLPGNKKKFQILGGLNPVGGANLDTLQKAGFFIFQMLTFLIIFAPLVYGFTSNPSASEFAMIGLGCNLLYISTVLYFIKTNGGIKNIMDVIMNCKLKTYCFHFVIAMGIWYGLFTSVAPDTTIKNSTMGMGLAGIFILAVLAGDKLMTRTKK